MDFGPSVAVSLMLGFKKLYADRENFYRLIMGDLRRVQRGNISIKSN